jgi:hypothetical protein
MMISYEVLSYLYKYRLGMGLEEPAVIACIRRGKQRKVTKKSKGG